EHQSQTIAGAGRESGEQDAPSLPDLLRQMPAERLVDIYRRSFLLRRLARLGPFRGKVTARPAAHVDNDGLAAADGLERMQLSDREFLQSPRPFTRRQIQAVRRQ